MTEIKVIDKIDRSDIFSNISKDIVNLAYDNFKRGNVVLHAGNILYQVLLRENQSEYLQNGETRFKRSPYLNPCSGLIISLDTGDAIMLEDYNL